MLWWYNKSLSGLTRSTKFYARTSRRCVRIVDSGPACELLVVASAVTQLDVELVEQRLHRWVHSDGAHEIFYIY